MNKSIDQTELGKQVAFATGISQSKVDAFIKQFFSEIENNLVEGIQSSVEGLGIFRIIKSGNTNKILFLGSKKNNKPSFTKESIDARVVIKTDNISSVKPITKVDSKNISSANKSKPKPNIVDLTRDKEEVIHNNDIKTEADNYKDKLESDHDLSNNFQKINTEVDGTINHEQIKREQKKKNAIILPIFISLLIIVVILGVSYLFFENAKKNSSKYKSQDYTVKFHELTVNDSINFNTIIIPDKDVSLEYIANIYYGDEIFWPYIYVANEDFMNNTTVALAGSIIKIPKLTVDLVAYNRGSVTTAAQKFGDEIKKSNKIY